MACSLVDSFLARVRSLDSLNALIRDSLSLHWFFTVLELANFTRLIWMLHCCLLICAEVRCVKQRYFCTFQLFIDVITRQLLLQLLYFLHCFFQRRFVQLDLRRESRHN